MAHGLPDYYRGVDIAYQALAELIVRPKYGSATPAIASKNVTANDETSIVSVSGKGMLYGGLLYLTPVASQKNDKPYLYCDGSKLSNLSFLTMSDLYISVAYSQAFYNLKYDDANKIYSAAICPYLTFESSFEVAYEETHGNTPMVYVRALYAII